MAVVLVGTLDTKGKELGFVRDLLHSAAIATLVIDVGSLGPPTIEPDIDRERVFFRALTSSDELRKAGDRGQAVAAAAQGVASLVAELHARGEVEGILAIGGSAGTTIGTAAMRALPFGVPKVMLSTLASGSVRSYVGGSDILMMHSVADIAGLNRLTRTVLANAAHAIKGMVLRDRPDVVYLSGFEGSGPVHFSERIKLPPRVEVIDEDRPVVAATMFGVTTPCVDQARADLEALGCEVFVFHATGVGGQAMEGLIRDGQVAGVLDLTTTELADEEVGGILSAGPDRLEAAGRRGIPQVVSVGALDMVNFGPRDTVPERFAGRLFHVHNANVTLMRTTPSECAAIGTRIARILARARGPVEVLLPLRGVSALDREGGPFFDPEADHCLFDAIEAGLKDAPRVRVERRDEHINDPAFAQAAARALFGMLGDWEPRLRDLARFSTLWAEPADLGEIASFLEAHALPADGLELGIDDALIVRGGDGRLLATALLERHGSIGFLRSLAVARPARGLGLGSRLVSTLLNRAAAEGLEEVVAQTKDAVDFFTRFGFGLVPRPDFDSRLGASPLWAHGTTAGASLLSRRMVSGVEDELPSPSPFDSPRP